MENAAFRLAFQFAKPFKPTETDGRVPFEEIPDLMGSYWLTSLGFRYKGLQDFEFIECVISINQDKNIVTTALQGRDGTIKEYISDGDYSISIEAGINNYKEGDETQASYDYPADKIRALHKYLKLKDAIDVQSDFLEIFGVRSAVIKSYNLVQETHSNRQGISISMLSDTPYEIKLKQNNVKVK